MTTNPAWAVQSGGSRWARREPLAWAGFLLQRWKGEAMEATTRQKIISLYWDWNKWGRDDYGLPLSLGDLLSHVKRDSEKRARGESAISIEQYAKAMRFPEGFAEALAAAVGEGITDGELAELVTVRALRKKPDKPTA